MVERQVKLFKALGDKSRLLIIASLMREPMYGELIAERLELNPSTVSHHLRILEKLGLVTSEKDQYYNMYSLDKKKLNFNVMGEISSILKEIDKQDNREEDYRKKIIDTFIKDGKLLSIPVQLKKRRVILEEIAENFEMGVEYPEKEVNKMIGEYHFDFCTIRREFIMERMFHRENGIYKRMR